VESESLASISYFCSCYGSNSPSPQIVVRLTIIIMRVVGLRSLVVAVCGCSTPPVGVLLLLHLCINVQCVE
jgi:hypothetical protein